jgi:hypothetical protein
MPGGSAPHSTTASSAQAVAFLFQNRALYQPAARHQLNSSGRLDALLNRCPELRVELSNLCPEIHYLSPLLFHSLYEESRQPAIVHSLRIDAILFVAHHLGDYQAHFLGNHFCAEDKRSHP